MNLLGNILKQAIHLAANVQKLSHTPPAESQAQTLASLLSRAKSTQFGQDHQFDSYHALSDPREAFAQSVPMFDYHQMADQYWTRSYQGVPDVAWPGSPEYFALSSGTTGNQPKRIPVTDAQLSSIRMAGIRQLLALETFDLPPKLFEKQVLMLGSSTDLQRQDEHWEGEISGISASNLPGWFDRYYKPGSDISGIDDWDERLTRISQAAPSWDIGALSGIPSWIQMMLERIITDHKLAHIHELWPDLMVYTTGGVAFAPYRAGFETLLDQPLHYLDTYLASEGFFGFTSRPGTFAMELVLDNDVYYEFIPFSPDTFDAQGKPYAEAPTVPIEQVQADTDYALLISSAAGAWRYLIGDTIAFTDPDRLEFRITGRTQGFLNVVGSQLSEQKLNDAIHHVETETGLNIKEYTVGAHGEEGSWRHRWYLGLEGEWEAEQAATMLDTFLQDRNKNYAVARKKSLKGVEVRFLSPDTFYEYQEQEKKKGGQVKMPRVLLGNKWDKWTAFLKETHPE